MKAAKNCFIASVIVLNLLLMAGCKATEERAGDYVINNNIGVDSLSQPVDTEKAKEIYQIGYLKSSQVHGIDEISKIAGIQYLRNDEGTLYSVHLIYDKGECIGELVVFYEKMQYMLAVDEAFICRKNTPKSAFMQLTTGELLKNVLEIDSTAKLSLVESDNGASTKHIMNTGKGFGTCTITYKSDEDSYIIDKVFFSNESASHKYIFATDLLA